MNSFFSPEFQPRTYNPYPATDPDGAMPETATLAAERDLLNEDADFLGTLVIKAHAVDDYRTQVMARVNASSLRRRAELCEIAISHQKNNVPVPDSVLSSEAYGLNAEGEKGPLTIDDITAFFPDEGLDDSAPKFEFDVRGNMAAGDEPQADEGRVCHFAYNTDTTPSYGPRNPAEWRAEY